MNECFACHNPDDPENADKREQWMESAHGGHIAEVKEGNVTGVVTEEEAPAWVHYDFKGDDRQACQRCHTSTGFMNLADDPANYDPANNTFFAIGEQREMLYCWACHTDNEGTIRDPGKFENFAPYSAPEDRISNVPDVKGSNVCLSCHSGRTSGAEVEEAEEIAGENFGDFNSHYLAAGGVLFKTIGYEYDGASYSSSIHAGVGSGDNGPCVACHMGGDAGHTFSVAETAEGNITAINSYNATCAECHPDEESRLETANELRDGYEASIEALEDQLAEKGIYYNSHAYPYFYPTSNESKQTYPNAYKDWQDKNVLGAAFNLNMLAHEPGAFIHNPRYTKQLLYDSIDYLDNGEMDSSVEDTLESGDAYEYLEGTR